MLELFTNLFPPEESSPEQTRQWRRSVSIAVIATGALTVANTILTWGLAPFLFSGFASVATLDASAKDIDNLQQTLTRQSTQMTKDKNELKVLLLQNQLNQLFDAWCGAVRGGRVVEADQWERQFNATVIEYNRISPQNYPMRRCG